MLWEVRPVEKKCVYMRTSYYVPDDSEIAAGKKFYMDEMYRWGRCVVRSDVKPEADAEDPYGNPFELGDYEIEDQESDDGCSLDFEFDDDDEWTEEERAYIEDLWEEDSWSAFDDNGIYADDCDTQYVGPLEVTCIDDMPEPAETPKPTSGWPF
jgi:hypothetical protein